MYFRLVALAFVLKLGPQFPGECMYELCSLCRKLNNDRCVINEEYGDKLEARDIIIKLTYNVFDFIIALLNFAYISLR